VYLESAISPVAAFVLLRLADFSEFSIIRAKLSTEKGRKLMHTAVKMPEKCSSD
jgi:hypothetical protein